MMIATGGGVIDSFRGRAGLSVCVSRDDIGDDHILDFLHTILDGQLFLLHALDLQAVAPGFDHCFDRRIEIVVILLEARKRQAQFGLILLGDCHGAR